MEREKKGKRARVHKGRRDTGKQGKRGKWQRAKRRRQRQREVRGPTAPGEKTCQIKIGVNVNRALALVYAKLTAGTRDAFVAVGKDSSPFMGKIHPWNTSTRNTVPVVR